MYFSFYDCFEKSQRMFLTLKSNARDVATSPSELYRMVLVDTPLGPYFGDCLSLDDLDEMNIEIIRNTLYKACCHHCGRLPARTATPARPPIRIALESRSRE